MGDKPDRHDCWEYSEKDETMRKFNINDRVVIEGQPLTEEWAAWGPKNRDRVPDEGQTAIVVNAVKKKVFGSTFWFHELLIDDDRYYAGPFNAADLAMAEVDNE